ncbi:MAG: SGNH/GDSL hydrolase family protein [Candidatus Brocadiia bacterium]
MGDLCVADGQKMVLIGDSITDCGRRAEAAPLGCGYVAFFADLLVARHPQRAVRVVNKGIGGNTAVELAARWETDVLAERPDWLAVMIGINDLHRTLAGVHHIPPPTYRELYTGLLQRVADEVGPGLVLLEPFYMTTEQAATEAQRQVLAALEGYRAVVGELAQRFAARRVPTHQVFQRQLRHRPPSAFGAEPVHPNRTGHVVIACALLDALED